MKTYLSPDEIQTHCDGCGKPFCDCECTKEITVTDLLIQNGIADNQFSAGHIATGLRLWECETDEAKLERARLYRKWRSKTETKKSKLIPTYQAYDLAINGIDPDDVEPRQIEFESGTYTAESHPNGN